CPDRRPSSMPANASPIVWRNDVAIRRSSPAPPARTSKFSLGASSRSPTSEPTVTPADMSVLRIDQPDLAIGASEDHGHATRRCLPEDEERRLAQLGGSVFGRKGTDPVTGGPHDGRPLGSRAHPS